MKPKEWEKISDSYKSNRTSLKIKKNGHHVNKQPDKNGLQILKDSSYKQEDKWIIGIFKYSNH